MTKKTKTFKFKDEKIRNKMLGLRRMGWTYKSIAVIYGVDHSSVYHWCKIKNIPAPKFPLSFYNIAHIFISAFTEKPIHEKSYKDYLLEAHNRRYPKRYALNKTV